MIIMLFGTSNVGKTVVGEKLAAKLGYTFADLDEELKERLNTTLEIFINSNPFPYERAKIKGKVLKEIIDDYKDNIVIAVSPIYYSSFFNPIIAREDVFAIELQDTEENIFDRLVFSDENDVIYCDDEYKELHRNHYMKEIHEDIMGLKKAFKKIECKYFIDNKPVALVADELFDMINGRINA